MGDISCAKCGEPWDAYGVSRGDMEPSEAQKFRKGQGCPSCGFGETCPSCSGSGRDREYAKCPSCYGRGRMRVWRPANDAGRYRASCYYTGYEPNVRKVSDADMDGAPAGWKLDRSYRTADGYVYEGRATCDDPACDFGGLPECLRCKGTGKLTVEDPEEVELEAARSACEESDEDPIAILHERRLI